MVAPLFEQIHLRPWKDSDFERAVTLNRQAEEYIGIGSESGDWAKDMQGISETFEGSGGKFLVGELDENMVVMGGFKRLSDTTGEVKRMRVSPELQGQGIGPQLLGTLENQMRERGIRKSVAKTLSVQEAALKLYSRAGYTETGREELTEGPEKGYTLVSFEKNLVSEQVGRFFEFIGPKLTGVPELQSALELAADNTEMTVRVFDQYVRVVERLSQLDDSEMSRIRRSSDKLRASCTQPDSASRRNALDILSLLDDSGRAELASEASRAVDPESPYLAAAVNDFVSRTEGGHQLKVEGKTPVDGDPASDKVIWGHTQITNPEALLHFMMSHYLERYFSQILAAQGVDFASNHKDYFLNAMTDVLMLDHYGKRQFDDIFNMWAQPRDEGGLGWIKPDRVQAYAPEQ